MLTRSLIALPWIAFALTASMSAGAQAAPAVDARSEDMRRASLRLTDFDWFNFVRVEAVQRRGVGSAGVTDAAQVRVHGLADYCGEDEDENPRWGRVLDTVDSAGVTVRVTESNAQAQGPVTVSHEARSCQTGELLSVAETTAHIDVVWTPFGDSRLSGPPRANYTIDVSCATVVAQAATYQSRDAMAVYAIGGLPPAFQALVDSPEFEIAGLLSGQEARATADSGMCGS